MHLRTGDKDPSYMRGTSKLDSNNLISMRPIEHGISYHGLTICLIVPFVCGVPLLVGGIPHA
jgi:hypothetical protein